MRTGQTEIDYNVAIGRKLSTCPLQLSPSIYPFAPYLERAFMEESGRRVLVVSTDLNFLRSLSQALTLGGYTVTTAIDVFEVLGKLGSMPSSVLLYELKDLDRREWEKLMDIRRAYPDLSLVLLSSLESPELNRSDPSPREWGRAGVGGG